LTTPPSNPNDASELLPPTKPRTELARLAIIFAVAAGISFGLCSVSATVGMGANPKIAVFLIGTSLVIEAVSILGLITVGVIALIRSLRS